jgi:hemerythrin-like domain-containing protein
VGRALLLDFIVRKADSIYYEALPDFELLHDILKYVTLYPDAVHRPKEDRLYRELKTVRRDLPTGIQRISVDRRAIVDLG